MLKIPSSSSNQANDSILGVANFLIAEDRIKVFKGGFIVRALKNCSYTVTLFPKTHCTCLSSRTCAHIMACTMIVGNKPVSTNSPSISSLRSKRRGRGRSGRKHPRYANLTKPCSSTAITDCSDVGKPSSKLTDMQDDVTSTCFEEANEFKSNDSKANAPVPVKFSGYRCCPTLLIGKERRLHGIVLPLWCTLV